MVNNMKMIKFEKFILIAVLSLLLSIQTAWSLGVTRPKPIDLRLLRGDTVRFYFEIQAITSPDKLSCSYSISGLDPLVITFDEKEAVVDAGNVNLIYGTVSVPADAPIKGYGGTLSLSCSPYSETQYKDYSGSVMHETVNVGFPMEVVLEKEERVVREIPPEVKEKPKASPIILILIIIVLILAIVGFYLSNKKKIQ